MTNETTQPIQTEVDELGFFGNYGGRYVPETLMPAIQELKQAYDCLLYTSDAADE